MEDKYTVMAEELIQFIARYESLEVQRKQVSDDQKCLTLEVKVRGYDPKILKKIVDMRRRDASELAEEEAILDTYKAAIGMN